MGLRDEEELEGRRGDPQEEEAEEEEEELEDPLIKIREQCEKLEKCVKTKEILDQCNSRVLSRTRTAEECSEELFDFLHARDRCVALKLFSSLK